MKVLVSVKINMKVFFGIKYLHRLLKISNAIFGAMFIFLIKCNSSEYENEW